MDVREELDAAFRTEPDHPPVDLRLRAGRRALRRRRLATGVATVATVAVVAGVAAMSGLGGQPSSGDSGIATPPSETPRSEQTSEPDSEPPEPTAPLRRDEWLGVDKDGELVLGPGVELVRRIENPMRLVPPATSVALELRQGDVLYWALFHADTASGPSIMSHFEARVGHEDLEAWTDDMIRLQRGQPLKQYVEFAGDGTLRSIGPHVDLVRQVADPDLPDNYDSGLETAVAEVEVLGTTHYVLARDPEDPDYIAVPASVGGETLADFLAYARDQYAGGAGLR